LVRTGAMYSNGRAAVMDSSPPNSVTRKIPTERVVCSVSRINEGDYALRN
jgi:hypothetical protein